MKFRTVEASRKLRKLTFIKVQTGYPGARGYPGSTGSDTTLTFNTGTRKPGYPRVPGYPRAFVNIQPRIFGEMMMMVGPIAL